MATSEIDGSYGLPRYVHTFTDKLQQILHDVGGKIIDNVIKPASSQRYACRLIQPANKNEEGSELQKKRTRRGMIQISGLIHKMENKSDPRLAWFMFHNIYCMYSDIKNKEEKNLLFYSQKFHNTKKPTKLTNNLNSHVIMMITINLFFKK